MSQSSIRATVGLVVMLTMLGQASPVCADTPTRAEAEAALRRAVTFFHEKVAVEGGYVYRYSADLTKREGEGKVGMSTVWVQPPGTPAVGMALVDAYEWTGSDFKVCLDAARDAAMCLVKGQLHSGGWTSRIDFDPSARKRMAYRIDVARLPGGVPAKKMRNYSTLDDDKTQAALRCLIRYDHATGFKDKVIHEATKRALESVLAAQFPNGGWPQGYTGPAAPGRYEPRKASYAPDGKYTREKAYWDFVTLNDDLIRDAVDTLALAEKVYGDERCRAAIERAGRFLILAQMPEPQPGWAQQYDWDMRPCWARRFEPPAITGGESQGAMRTLMRIYELTGDRQYLAPLPKALAYYKRSLLPDGRLARFYEPMTNKPLYFNRQYELTYKDDDLPTHYGFKVTSKLDQIEAKYKDLTASEWKPPSGKRHPPKVSAAKARAIIQALDERGAWVEDGSLRYWGKGDPTKRVISSATFAENVRALAGYVAGTRGRD